MNLQRLTQLSFLPLLSLFLTFSGGQQLPDNACSQYFQYLQSGIGGLYGELTLALQNGRNRIDMRFSQRGAQDVSTTSRKTWILILLLIYSHSHSILLHYITCI